MSIHQELLNCIDRASREVACRQMCRWGEQHGYEHLIEEVLLAAMRHDPRFILSTTGADISTDTPEENLHVIRRLAEYEVPDYAAV